MLTRRVAIIGAGLSGLAAAKAAIECGLEPILYEKSATIGGVWRGTGGFAWPDMRTNLSKWTCAFSDFPWPDDADEFPLSADVALYLRSYADRFKLLKRVRLSREVRRCQQIEKGWRLHTANGPPEDFHGVIAASGAFARPFVPDLPGLKSFMGRTLHAAEYPHLRERPKRVAVVGASLSGIEIASHLADAGAEVVILFNRAPWILPRYAATENGVSAPLDLVLYNRPKPALSAPVDIEEQNRKAAEFLDGLFGNPGTVHPALATTIDGSPPYVAISDTFLRHVKNGAITPIKSKISNIGERAIETSSGGNILADMLILCTGYNSDLSYLPEDVQKSIEYRPSDRLVSYIADRAVVHPRLKNLYFVGLYRGPYFGVVELQARWAAMLLSNSVPAPSIRRCARGMQQERSIRERIPRPQFPHGDYLAFADSIANEIGALPEHIVEPSLQHAVDKGPVVPGQYRLAGPFSNKAVAGPFVISALRRVGM